MLKDKGNFSTIQCLINHIIAPNLGINRVHFCDFNVHHYCPKIDELRISLAHDHCPDIFAMCETFLTA